MNLKKKKVYINLIRKLVWCFLNLKTWHGDDCDSGGVEKIKKNIYHKRERKKIYIKRNDSGSLPDVTLSNIVGAYGG